MPQAVGWPSRGIPVQRARPLAPALRLPVFPLLLGLMLADPLVAMIKIALERQSLRNESNG